MKLFSKAICGLFLVSTFSGALARADLLNTHGASITSQFYATQVNAGADGWNLFRYDGDRIRTATSAQLQFLGLSSEATSLQTEIDFTNQAFSQILASRTPVLRIRAEWRLDICDNQKISNAPIGSAMEISQIISTFSSYDFSRYMKCSFVLKAWPICSENGGMLHCRGAKQASEYYNHEYISLSFLDNGDLVLEGPSTNIPATYFRNSLKPDPAAERASLDAAQELAGILKNYGNTLLTMRNAPPKDRSAAIKLFIARNRDSIVQSIDMINKAIAATSLLTKINVTSTINRGYGYVHFLEGKIQGSFPLDEVIVAK